MNRYRVQIDLKTNEYVNADGFDTDGAGAFVFWRASATGEREQVAAYPVSEVYSVRLEEPETYTPSASLQDSIQAMLNATFPTPPNEATA